MEGENIKRIAQFAHDGIKQAMAVGRVLEEKERSTFEEMSTRLLSALGTPSRSVEKKTPKKKVVPTSQDIFALQILPQIRCKLAKYE